MKTLKAVGEKQLITYPQGYQLIFQQKLCGPEMNGVIYSKCWGRGGNKQQKTLQPRIPVKSIIQNR